LAIVVKFKQGGFVLGNISPACVVYVDRDSFVRAYRIRHRIKLAVRCDSYKFEAFRLGDRDKWQIVGENL